MTPKEAYEALRELQMWRRAEGVYESDKTIIYIPTEGGLPILESTRSITK